MSQDPVQLALPDIPAPSAEEHSVELGLYMHDDSRRVYEVFARTLMLKFVTGWIKGPLVHYRSVTNPAESFTRFEGDFLRKFYKVERKNDAGS